jgi:hypothetical protein
MNVSTCIKKYFHGQRVLLLSGEHQGRERMNAPRVDVSPLSKAYPNGIIVAAACGSV